MRDLSEDELIRRIGADPARCPSADPEHAPFDQADFDESLRHVGVRSVEGAPGGCVITQDGYMPSDNALMQAISAGTTAYGVYFNAKGGTFGTLARDGEIVAYEEIGLPPQESDPAAHWTFRFWQGKRTFPYGAEIFAYACAAGRPEDRRRPGRGRSRHPTPLGGAAYATSELSAFRDGTGGRRAHPAHAASAARRSAGSGRMPPPRQAPRSPA